MIYFDIYRPISVTQHKISAHNSVQFCALREKRFNGRYIFLIDVKEIIHLRLHRSRPNDVLEVKKAFQSTCNMWWRTPSQSCQARSRLHQFYRYSNKNRTVCYAVFKQATKMYRKLIGCCVFKANLSYVNQPFDLNEIASVFFLSFFFFVMTFFVNLKFLKTRLNPQAVRRTLSYL